MEWRKSEKKKKRRKTHQSIAPSHCGSPSGQMTPSALYFNKAISISNTSIVRLWPLMVKWEVQVVTFIHSPGPAAHSQLPREEEGKGKRGRRQAHRDSPSRPRRLPPASPGVFSTLDE